MHLKTRNVNSAFRELVTLFNTGVIGNAPVQLCKGTKEHGNVTMIDEPVTVSYQHPTERVLINPGLDCNPFFHLYEALWMLAGRNDVAPLAYYNSKMPEFSDDGKTFNGAYGYRWRWALADTGYRSHGNEHSRDDPRIPVDQLDLIVAHLKAKPDSRRAVLQMWNVEDDLLKIGGGPCQGCPTPEIAKEHGFRHGQHALYTRGIKSIVECNVCKGTGIDPGYKDVCCNLSVMFSLRMDERTEQTPHLGDGTYGIVVIPKLDMTVANRSNDLVWGMLGANAMQFSILQEYMAARLGASVGWYHQITNNLHAYEATWEPVKWLAQYHNRTMFSPTLFDYDRAVTVPLVKDPEVFEQELPLFVGAFNGEEEPWSCVPSWREPFFQEVAGPMLTAFRRYKTGGYKVADNWVDLIKADDWRRAAGDWLQTRVEKRKLKEGSDA